MPARRGTSVRSPSPHSTATHFHDFAATVASWTEQDGVATIAPLLVQPIAPADVADVLAEIAAGKSQGRHVDVAGPEPQDLVDMARRTNDARGHAVKLVPTWSATFGPEMAGNVLLPDEGARVAPTTFDEWLAEVLADWRGPAWASWGARTSARHPAGCAISSPTRAAAGWR